MTTWQHDRQDLALPGLAVVGEPVTQERRRANWHVATGTPVASLLDRLDRQAREILSDPRATTAGYPATLAGALTAAFEQLTATAAGTVRSASRWTGH